MNNTRYSYHCYKMLRNLDNSGRPTWATKVKAILFIYGFGYVWVNENVGDETLFLKMFKKRLLDCSKQEWQDIYGGLNSTYSYKTNKDCFLLKWPSRTFFVYCMNFSTPNWQEAS